ncbi:hypothetical protein ACQ4PT_059550 [Festuca glaucescens]
MATENYDPDQPVVHRYLPVWAKLPAFGAKPAFVWADDGTRPPATCRARHSPTPSSTPRWNACMASGLLGTLRRGDTVLVLASSSSSSRASARGSRRCPSYRPTRPGPARLTRTSCAADADACYVDAVAGASGTIAAALSGLRWLSVEELELEGGVAAGCGQGADDTYLIQYTSGATGVPKPVAVTAGSAAHNCSGAATGAAGQPAQPDTDKRADLQGVRGRVRAATGCTRGPYGLAENCTFVSTAWRRSTSQRAEELPSHKEVLPSSSSMAHEAPEIEITVVNEESGEPVADGVEGGGVGFIAQQRLEAFCARMPGPGRAGSSCFVRTGDVDRGVITGAER